MLIKPYSKDQMLECNPGLGSFYRGRVKVVEGPGFDSREREMSQFEFSQKSLIFCNNQFISYIYMYHSIYDTSGFDPGSL